MFEEKHHNRGAIKCLDIMMEGMVDYYDFGRFEVIHWNWNYCRFTWQSMKSF